MKKEFSKTSPYQKTPIKDFYLDLWEYIPIKSSVNDSEVVISPTHHLRPDLLAYEMYGYSELYWVFYLRNLDIMDDPINDFVAGKVIFVPSLEYIKNNVLT